MKRNLFFPMLAIASAIAMTSCGGGNKGGGPASEISVTTPSPMEVSRAKADYQVSLTSNGSWSTIASSWIAVDPRTGTGDATVTVTVSLNTGAARTGTVTFTGADGVKATFDIVQQMGEANSYIVAPGGSVEVPISRANADGTTRINDADAVTAEFLWGDNAGQGAAGIVNTLAVEGTGADRCIRVTAGSTEGNAVIAVEVGGVVKWSWHIWVTSFDPVATGQTYVGSEWTGNGQYVGKKIMDRNLGALSATPTTANTKTMGLMYQWGRKDPFPGHFQNWTDDTTEPTINYGGTATITKVAVTTDNNLEMSIANPMTIYYNATSGDWYASNVANVNSNLWGDTGHPKTVYDPCPAGWKVPARTVYNDFADNTVTPPAYKNTVAYGYKSTWVDLATAQSATGAMSGAGCYYSPTTSTTPPSSYPVYLPATGVRNTSGDFASVGTICAIWSASISSNAQNGSYLNAASNYPNYSAVTKRALGIPTRCIQE